MPSAKSEHDQRALEAMLQSGPPHSGGSTFVPVFVQPRASRSKWVGLHDGMLKVAIAAPPVDGAANKALRAFIAKTFGVSKRDVTLVAGQSSRRKRFLVAGRTPAEVAVQLQGALG